MRLSEINAETGCLEDLAICGLDTIERMLELQRDEIEGLDPDEAGNLEFFNAEIKNKVADLKDALGRFESQLMGLRRLKLKRSIEQSPSTAPPSGTVTKIKRLRRAT